MDVIRDQAEAEAGFFRGACVTDEVDRRVFFRRERVSDFH
jgi:hypothetical protein